jgi:hypothetical protein
MAPKPLRPGDNGDSRLNPDWRELAERAEKETDPKKLIQLVKALCDRLEELQAIAKPKA